MSTEEEYLQQTIELYNWQAATYKKFKWSFQRHQEFYDAFLGAIPGKRILDLGSGSGLDLLYFSEAGYEVKGVEISQGSIDLYPDEIKSLVLCEDMRNIDKLFEAKSFDGVRSIASIVHMNKEWWTEVLQKIYNLLVEWGALFVTTKLRVDGQPEDTVKESNSIPWSYKRFVYWKEAELSEALTNIWFEVKQTTIHNYGQEDSRLAILATK